MSIMIRTDLITMKNSLLQLMGILLIVGIAITLGMGSLLAGAAAMASMLPVMYIFSIGAYDEAEKWEQFRLTLPISRHQVVWGRYTSILLVTLGSAALALGMIGLEAIVASAFPGIPVLAALFGSFDLLADCGHLLVVAAAMLVVAAASVPLFMRFGMTKGSRLMPLLTIAVVVAAIWFADEASIANLPFLGTVLQGGADATLASLGLGAGAIAIALTTFFASALVSIRLYEKRQF